MTNTYQAQSRNKLITEAFYLTKDIEKYGSGYRRVRELIADYPTMYFNFMETSGGFLTKIGYRNQKIYEQLPYTTKANVTKDVTKDPNKRRAIILNLITQKPTITTSEIAAILHITRRTTQRDIDNLRSNNKIQHIGGRRDGYWETIQ